MTAYRDGDRPDDLAEALRAENESLQIRVNQLEAATAEYRKQMASVVTSASWRLTAPLRGVAGSVRLLRRRSRSVPARIAQRRRVKPSPTAGLFHPQAHGLASPDSPLLTRPLGGGPFALPPAGSREASDPRVLVVAHVYYPEVWADLASRLHRIPEPFELIVTLVDGRAEGLDRVISQEFPQVRFHHVHNQGRDLAPLIDLASRGLLHGYDAVLKIHTKRSPHRLDGDIWRQDLLDGVLPSKEGVRRILELLRRDRNVGLVSPPGHIRGPETWGSDEVLVQALAARIPFAFDANQLRYPAGSMYWARPWLLQRLSDLQLEPEHFEPEADHLDGSTAHALERFVGVAAAAAGLAVVDGAAVPSRLHQARKSAAVSARVLAFYLPQYHRIPENDAWWGEGFTDWVNTARSRPLFAEHRQPRLPGELGTYDLSDPEVMRAQGRLARQHGVAGFVMHHYWFDGYKVLQTPLQHLLADPSIDFPFALCWANEPWTRSWDGLSTDVLIAQDYVADFANAFYEDIQPALRDPRYVRVDGMPLLVIYRAGHLPDGGTAVRRWKERARADGLCGLHVVGVTPSRDFEPIPPSTAAALDGLVRFPPGSGIGLQSLRGVLPGGGEELDGDVYSYDAAIDGADMSIRSQQGLRIHPGVMPGWDNTPRRGSSAHVFHGGNPLSFRRWLSKAEAASSAAGPDALVFINAWNEWAEGAALEPDARFGRALLETVREIFPPEQPPAVPASL